jgi:hypothetical protein
MGLVAAPGCFTFFFSSLNNYFAGFSLYKVSASILTMCISVRDKILYSNCILKAVIFERKADEQGILKLALSGKDKEIRQE